MEEERKGGVAIWSMVTIVVLIVGFVLTIFLMGKALDAKIDGVQEAVKTVGTIDSVKEPINSINVKLGIIEKKLDALAKKAAAPPAPPAPTPEGRGERGLLAAICSGPGAASDTYSRDRGA